MTTIGIFEIKSDDHGMEWKLTVDGDYEETEVFDCSDDLIEALREKVDEIYFKAHQKG